jgi:hypothetical protein
VAQWKDTGILQAFYGDPTRYAYSFQTYVFATRILAIHAAMAAKPSADMCIFERSPVTDPIFMCLQAVEPLERAMYSTWCEAWRGMSTVDYSQATALYLRTSPEVCMARVASRAREGEILPHGAEIRPRGTVATATAAGGVSPEYQALLRRAHEAFFLGLHPGLFPSLPPNPIRRVIEVSPLVADGDYRPESPGSKNIIADILSAMGFP